MFGEAIKRLDRFASNLVQIWFMSAELSGNGHRLNTIRPTVPQGHFAVL